MAITFVPTIRHAYSVGDRKEAIFDIAYSGTPTVGGDILSSAALGFTSLDTVDVVGIGSNAGATAGYAIGIIHSGTPYTTTGSGATTAGGVLVTFMVQGTAGAGNPLIAATGALTAGSFRARVVGKGGAIGVPS